MPLGATRLSVAAVFPVMVDVHLVTYAMMMLISLGGSDRAQSDNGCGNGEDEFFHYRILKSMCGTTFAARSVP